jgi:hypothetical protein
MVNDCQDSKEKIEEIKRDLARSTAHIYRDIEKM